MYRNLLTEKSASDAQQKEKNGSIHCVPSGGGGGGVNKTAQTS